MQSQRTAAALRTTLAGITLVSLPLLVKTSQAQVPNLRGTPISIPSDCRTGACAQTQPTQNVAATWTPKRATDALAGYWAANNRVSFLIFVNDEVARLVEVVDGQVTRDRQATLSEAGPDIAKPGHLMFNVALQTTADAAAPIENINLEFYRGMHTVDLNLAPERHVRLWFVRKTDQIDVDALEHPRAPRVHTSATSESPEPLQRLGTPGVCPEARAWQGSLQYPVSAMQRGIRSGSVTLGFVARPDGATAEYRVENATSEFLIGPSLEALARLHCTGVSTGQVLQQTIDYKTE